MNKSLQKFNLGTKIKRLINFSILSLIALVLFIVAIGMLFGFNKDKPNLNGINSFATFKIGFLNPLFVPAGEFIIHLLKGEFNQLSTQAISGISFSIGLFFMFVSAIGMIVMGFSLLSCNSSLKANKYKPIGVLCFLTVIISLILPFLCFVPGLILVTKLKKTYKIYLNETKLKKNDVNPYSLKVTAGSIGGFAFGSLVSLILIASAVGIIFGKKLIDVKSFVNSTKLFLGSFNTFVEIIIKGGNPVGDSIFIGTSSLLILVGGLLMLFSNICLFFLSFVVINKNSKIKAAGYESITKFAVINLFVIIIKLFTFIPSFILASKLSKVCKEWKKNYTDSGNSNVFVSVENKEEEIKHKFDDIIVRNGNDDIVQNRPHSIERPIYKPQPQQCPVAKPIYSFQQQAVNRRPKVSSTAKSNSSEISKLNEQLRALEELLAKKQITPKEYRLRKIKIIQGSI